MNELNEFINDTIKSHRLEVTKAYWRRSLSDLDWALYFYYHKNKIIYS